MRTISVRPACTLAAALAIAALAGGSPVRAQSGPGDARSGYDPPDTVYTTGDDEPIDAARNRSLPTVRPYRAFLPVSVDLSNRMPAAGRQGKLSSCTAWAVAYATRGYYAAAYEGRDLRNPSNLPSPAYVYHLSRGPECTGTSFIKAVDVLSRGAPSLAAYPYADQCAPPPSPEVVARATDFRVRGYRRIDLAQIDDIKGQLAQSNPVLISFADSPAFHRHRGDGVFEEPAYAGPNYGWHAMTLVGYDDRRQAFRLINSWGQGWGDRGLAWVSYDVVRTRVRAAGILDVERPQRPTASTEPFRPAPPAPATAPPSGPQAMVSPPRPSSPRADLPELQRLTCARVTAERQGSRTILSGFVASTADYDIVRRATSARPDMSLGHLMVAPWPQCEAMQTLDAALTAPDRPIIDVGPPSEPRDGDVLRIVVRTPSQPRFLYVSYIQVDGSLVHLVQPKGPAPQPMPGNRTLVFGDGSDGRPRVTISGPFGREMIIAVASRRPLVAGELPLHQTDREYLSALRRALIFQSPGASLDNDVTAAVRAVETRAR